MKLITSKSNAQLKKVRQLIDSTKARKESGLFVGEGSRFFSEIPSELIKEVYISESASKEMNIPNAQIVGDEAFKSLSATVNPQGVLAVIKKPEMSPEKFMTKFISMSMTNMGEEPDGRKLAIILDDIRDPGNLGTMIRTAEAAGAGVILSPGCVDLFNPKVVRSTMGSIFRVPILISELDSAISLLKEQGLKIYAAALEDSISLEELEPAKDRAYIIGNEANGISPEVMAMADVKVRIPMKGKIESLNAAVSAAILMYR